MTKFKLCSIKTVVGLALIGGVAYGGYYLHFKRTMKTAQANLEKGFPAVAAEDLERHRTCMIDKKDRCQLLLSVYYAARWVQRLDWAAQACLSKSIEIPEVYLGLAAAKEMSGRVDEALQVLGGAIAKFKEIPDIYYRMAQLLSRQENHQASVVAFQQAMQIAPNNAQIALEALDYFSRLKVWAPAKEVADRLRGAQSNNPAIKLLLARVYKNSGDDASATALIAEAQPLLSAAPNKADIEAAFADVLNPSKKKN